MYSFALSSDNINDDSNSNINSDNNKSFIKWVDFNVCYDALNDTSKLDISSHSENSYSKTDVYYFFPFYIQIPRKHNRKSNST